jgi:hypothetical protein
MYYNVVHALTQFVKDVIVDTLIIEEDRPAHIAKHNIIIGEVLEVLTGNYVYIAGRENRWLVIGKTAKKVFLTIVLGGVCLSNCDFRRPDQGLSARWSF